MSKSGVCKRSVIFLFVLLACVQSLMQSPTPLGGMWLENTTESRLYVNAVAHAVASGLTRSTNLIFARWSSGSVKRQASGRRSAVWRSRSVQASQPIDRKTGRRRSTHRRRVVPPPFTPNNKPNFGIKYDVAGTPRQPFAGRVTDAGGAAALPGTCLRSRG